MGGFSMSKLFYSTWMARTSGSLGWDTWSVSFQRTPIWGFIQLSSFSIQEGNQFSPFRPRYAMGDIETVNTPTMVIGGITIPNPDKLRDNNVFLTTDHLTFQLQTDGVVSASGFIQIFDMSSTVDAADPANVLEFAVYDDGGEVIGTHHEVQLYGGEESDADAVQQAVLARANADAGRPLNIVPVNFGELPAGGAFRIDPRTRQPVPLNGTESSTDR